MWPLTQAVPARMCLVVLLSFWEECQPFPWILRLIGCRVGTAGGMGWVLPKNEATQRTTEPTGQETASHQCQLSTWIRLSVQLWLGFFTAFCLPSSIMIFSVSCTQM